MKIALGPTCQPPPLSLSLFLPRRGMRRRRPTPTRAGHPRPPCHARPPLALILPRGCVPLFLLFLLAHEPSRAARRHPDSLAAVDSSPPVGLPSIPRAGSSLSLSSSDSDAYPALGLAVQGRRRSPPPATAHRRGAAASPPLLACITAGEARLPPLHAVRARPEPLRPRPAAPPSVGAAACARRARGRAQARGQGGPWP
jgi:hypothetical protein